MSNSKKIGNIKDVLEKIIDNPYNYAKQISVSQLVTILRKLSYHYYNTQENLVPDAIYDVLKNVLEERDPTNSFITEVGAPISKDKVKLPHHMASLNKIKPATDELSKWRKKYPGPYVLSDKLDGVSGLLVNSRGKFKLYTRGDGRHGQDISYLVPHVVNKGIMMKDIPDKTAIRGELIISKKNFKKVQKDYANARNAVAGLVNAKHYSMQLAKLTEFVAYAIVHPRYRQHIQMGQLENWKINTVNYSIHKNITNDGLSKLLEDRRTKGTYEVDGIVVVDSSKDYNHTEENPKYGFAFKTILTDQIAEVTVVDVEWNCSKDGFLKPRVIIEPVKLVGVTITYATAFNAKFVVDNNLGPGATIKLIRSGDVIPHILEVLKPSATGKPKMPNTPYKWNKTGVDLLVKDIHGACGDEIIIKSLTHFFKTIGVKHISEGIIRKLVDNEFKSIKDIIGAKPEDFVDIEGVGMILMNKIFDNIKQKLQTTTLEQLMAATNILGRGIGVRKLKLITKAYPNIMNEKWDKKKLRDKIIALEGFDDITASLIASNFSKFKDLFAELEKVADIKHLKNPPKKKGIHASKKLFQNEKVVFTGFRSKEMEEFIESHGGKVSSSVSSNTTLVIYADDSGDSSKFKKAKELKIKMIPKNLFVTKYMKKIVVKI
jgi:NAD-dependent DNA ligase